MKNNINYEMQKVKNECIWINFENTLHWKYWKYFTYYFTNSFNASLWKFGVSEKYWYLEH